jgi:hypothetical protein
MTSMIVIACSPTQLPTKDDLLLLLLLPLIIVHLLLQ